MDYVNRSTEAIQQSLDNVVQLTSQNNNGITEITIKATLYELNINNSAININTEVFDTAKKVEALSKDFIAEIDVLKNIIKQANPLDPETDRLPAESMGKGDLMDEYLFTGDKSNANGQKFVEAVDTYHKGMVTLLSNNNSILREIDVDFNTKPVMVDGVEKSWLDYNFKNSVQQTAYDKPS